MIEKILVVDDHHLTRRVVATLLESNGYATVAACSGEEALTICEKRDFDCVIMDLVLPGIDGWETMKRLRNRWKSMNSLQLPFVVLSARSDREDIIRAYASGVSYYMCKPCRSDEVLAGVRMAIRFDGLRRSLSMPSAEVAASRKSA